MDPSTISVAQVFGSLAGIIGVTILLIGIGKRFVGNWPWVSVVPTWVYAIVIAAGLTLGANRMGVLAGNLGDLLLQAVVLAAASSGFREWFAAGLTTPIRDSSAARSARGDFPW